MHVKPLKHVNVLFTSIQMKGSLHFVFTTLIIILFVAYTSEGNHTLHVNKLTCTQQHMNTQTISIANYVRSMERVGTQMQTSYSGTAHSGTGNDSCYVLVECYSYLFPEDCTLCYTQARNLLRRCFPSTGGQIFLDGCFARFQNYNFYQEYAGPNDSVICGNATRSRVFQNSVRQAITNVVRDAPRNGDYFAQQVALSDAANESVYVLANCWVTLDETSCTKCLDSAFGLILKCLPLSEGRALQTGCFIRYSDTNFFNPESAMAGIGGKTLAIVMVVTSIVAFLAAFYSWKHRSKRIKGSVDTKLLKILNSSSLSFKYSTIEKATNSFNEANKLGQGGFGTVYKGVLPDGKEVAVKRLFFNHRHRAKDFYYEVNIISSVNHRNLVKLVGFSCLGPESILVYEYLPNRSLDNFIFGDPVKGKELDWAKRFDIIVGIAEGLAYLHENSKTKIIHRDIKAANILLDSRLRAKIADFGLARSFQQDKNHISTGIAGTLGYMAPEYISHGKLTEKVDVYSFGILLLEVATGMPNRGVQTSEYTHSLVSTAWKHFKKGSVEELFDPRLMFNNQTSSRIKEEIQSVIHIGLLCIQEVASLRPTMSMALQMLSKNIQPLPSPANPPYIPESSIQLNEFGPIHGINNPASVPTVSISSFIPR